MTSPDPAPPRPRVHVLTLRPDGAREDTARRVGAVLAEAFATDPYTLGLVPEDRRGVLVRLTEAGEMVVDDAFTRLIQAEKELLAELTASQERELAGLLRRLLAPYGEA